MDGRTNASNENLKPELIKQAELIEKIKTRLNGKAIETSEVTTNE